MFRNSIESTSLGLINLGIELDFCEELGLARIVEVPFNLRSGRAVVASDSCVTYRVYRASEATSKSCNAQSK
jgi:hypothetical protein